MIYLRSEAQAMGSCTVPSKGIGYSVLPKHGLDLVPLLELLGVSQAVEKMADRIQAMQDEVS